MLKKYLPLPGYVVALSLVLFPLIDSLLSVWPARVSEVAWRFGTVGLFSRAIMTPLLGLLLAYAVALLLEHRVMLRVLSVLSALGALLVVGGTTMFVLDALQMRVQVVAQAKTAFDVASATALFKYFFGLVVLIAFSWGGWSASRRSSTERRKAEGDAGMLVVGGAGAPA